MPDVRWRPECLGIPVGGGQLPVVTPAAEPPLTADADFSTIHDPNAPLALASPWSLVVRGDTPISPSWGTPLHIDTGENGDVHDMTWHDPLLLRSLHAPPPPCEFIRIRLCLFIFSYGSAQLPPSSCSLKFKKIKEAYGGPYVFRKNY